MTRPRDSEPEADENEGAPVLPPRCRPVRQWRPGASRSWQEIGLYRKSGQPFGSSVCGRGNLVRDWPVRALNLGGSLKRWKGERVIGSFAMLRSNLLAC